MVTPCSLFEQMDGHKYLKTRDSLGETAIGALPQETDQKTLELALHSEDAAGDVDMEHALEPLVEGAAGLDGIIDDAGGDDHDLEEATPHEADSSATKPRTRKRRSSTSAASDIIWLWLPLTFKAVPQKVRHLSYIFSTKTFFILI